AGDGAPFPFWGRRDTSRRSARLSRVTEPAAPRDVHSHANPAEVHVRHLELDLDVDFPGRALRGSVILHVDRRDPSASVLRPDTRSLEILGGETAGPGDFARADWELGSADPILGAALSIPLRPADDRVRVAYATRPSASGLQWLEPLQTAGKRHPFLFS